MKSCNINYFKKVSWEDQKSNQKQCSASFNNCIDLFMWWMDVESFRKNGTSIDYIWQKIHQISKLDSREPKLTQVPYNEIIPCLINYEPITPSTFGNLAQLRERYRPIDVRKTRFFQTFPIILLGIIPYIIDIIIDLSFDEIQPI